VDEVRIAVYGRDADLPHLETAPVKAIHEVVKVDYQVHGCPIDAEELSRVIRSLLAGKEPVIPDYPVCVECKMRENCCRYEYGEVCLGPITRAGCGARCPSNGFWCFGCRGYVPNPNTHAAREVMARYGKTIGDLRSRMLLFGSRQEFTL
jgi:coenzyme F420-reducing hydrogenase gamma subunit